MYFICYIGYSKWSTETALMRDLERVPGVGSAAMFTRDASLEL